MSEEIKKFIEDNLNKGVRKVFLDHLPKRKDNKIDWIKSSKLKCKVYFIYEDIFGEIEIIDYISKGQKLTIEYKDNIYDIYTSVFLQCGFGNLFKYELYNCLYDKTSNKYLDLRNLPIKYNGIDWTKVAINKLEIPFKYNEICGVFKIISYDIKTKTITFEYFKNCYRIGVGAFIECRFGKILGVITNEFKIEIGRVFKDNKRDLVITDREYRVSNSKQKLKWYKYTCNKCGWTEGWIVESALLRGNNCSCCSNRTIVEGINDIPTTAPWMVKYFQGGYDEAKTYSKGSSKRIYPICPDCGRVKDNKMYINEIYKYCSIGCNCSDKTPYPEKLMFLILEQLNIYFKYQLSKTTFEWCGSKKYDFYFTYNNECYIVETHGEQHYKKSFETCGGDSLEEVQVNDKYKKELALANGIKKENYIVIDCRKSELEFIKQNILNSRLNEIFDLSNIDWLKCEKHSLNNLVKEICDIKRNNSKATTTYISYITGIGVGRVLKYLKQGNELGWCYYNVEEESMKSKYNPKPIEIFKHGESLGIFSSIYELSTKSESLFGIKLYSSNISSVCNGKRKTHKGFTYKYVIK